MAATDFVPQRGPDMDARIRAIEDWALRNSGRTPIQANVAVNAQAQVMAGAVSSGSGGGSLTAAMIPEADIVFDPGNGHSHDGVYSHTIAMTGDVAGNNTATTVAQIQGKAIPAPVAGNDGQFVKWNNGGNTYAYAKVPLAGDVTGDNTAAVVAQIQGKPIPVPAVGDDQHFVQWNNGTSAFRYVAGSATLSGDVTGPNTATVVGKANGVTLPTPGVGNTDEALYYDGSAYVLRATRFKVKTITHTDTPYGAAADDTVILVDASAGVVTVTLPSSVADKVYVVKKIDAAANNVTVATTGGQTIDGATPLTIAVQYNALRILGDGSAWWLI